jgi:hypothetical protein
MSGPLDDDDQAPSSTVWCADWYCIADCCSRSFARAMASLSIELKDVELEADPAIEASLPAVLLSAATRNADSSAQALRRSCWRNGEVIDGAPSAPMGAARLSGGPNSRGTAKGSAVGGGCASAEPGAAATDGWRVAAAAAAGERRCRCSSAAGERCKGRACAERAQSVRHLFQAPQAQLGQQ